MIFLAWMLCIFFSPLLPPSLQEDWKDEANAAFSEEIMVMLESLRTSHLCAGTDNVTFAGQDSDA